MGSSAWKDAERRVAKVIGGKRKSRGGNFGISDADIEHDWLSPEVKYRSKVPAYINAWLQQAKSYDAMKRKLPVAILMEKGKSWKNGVVMMKLVDFKEWFGGFEKKGV